VGELILIGLGLHGPRDITIAGLEAARECDVLFSERYTSRMKEGALEELSQAVGKPITILGREEVEDGAAILEAASGARVGFLVPGDPMTATTHVELRLQAEKRGIAARIIHGQSILTAAAGQAGLQAYKFGRTVSLPFPEGDYRPGSPLELIEGNLERGLHTLVLLDIKEDGTAMTANEAIDYLLSIREAGGAFGPETDVVALSRVGSPDPKLLAGPAARLVEEDLGPPLHCLIVPGELHFKEREALEAFAGLSPPSTR
jgi:diphthine synthase